MKKLILNIVCQVGISLFAQECDIQQYIVDNYTEDAKLLSLREIYSDTNHQYQDSIFIPQDIVNKYFESLSAIFNLKHLAVDTIFNIYEIHVFCDIPNQEISMLVDTSYEWIKSYLQDSLISGNPKFDSIITTYDFKLQSYIYASSFTLLSLTTSNYLNLYPIVDSLSTIPGLDIVEPSGNWVGDGNNIKISSNNDTMIVRFSIGWGDCPAGCIWRHYWNFKVIDCNAEYIGSSGDNISKNESILLGNYRIYPNPVDNYLNIDPYIDLTRIDIYQINGIKTMSIENTSGQIDLSKLKPGQYILELYKDNKKTRIKIIKR